MRRALGLCGLVLVTGCSQGVSGTWIGNMNCATLPFDMELQLEHEEKLTYTGTGTQIRSFKDVEGNETVVDIAFDVSLTLDSAKGAQDLETELTCTEESTVRYLKGMADPEVVAEGCTPRRYADYTIAWDGEDKLTIAGLDKCAGSFTRR